MKLYLVGGTIRDHLFSKQSADYDFAVEAGSYAEMRAWLLGRGVHIWQERPEFVTVRGFLPRHTLGDFGGLLPPIPRDRRVNADFTLCRAEAMYHDKRHPSVVTPAPLHVDLSRRDFTINAIAVSEEGEWIDPFGGREDALVGHLHCVGDPKDRFAEDPLRMLRALRFAVQYGLEVGADILTAIHDPEIVMGLTEIPHERVREELNKALSEDWYGTVLRLVEEMGLILDILASGVPALWLKATFEDR